MRKIHKLTVARACSHSSRKFQSYRQAAGLVALAALAGTAGLVRPALAANDSWSTTPVSNAFTGNNWTIGATTPGAPTGTISGGDALFFGNSGTTNLNNDEPTDFAPSGITFNAGANAFTISGNELDLSSSPVTNTSTAVQTFNNRILLNSTQTFTTSASGGDIVLAGAVAGGGGITKNGSGTLTLSGVGVSGFPLDTYNGDNTFTGGVVRELNSAGALGQFNTTNLSGGVTVELKNTTAANIIQAGTTFAGTGTLQKTGIGVVVIGGNGGGIVNVSLNAGSLIDVKTGQLVGTSSGKGVWTANQASMNIATGASFEGDESPIFLDALTGSGTYLGGYAGGTTTTIGVANGSGTFTGRLLDSRDGGGILSLTKTGTGTEILTNDNTFSGNTIVTGGTLELDNNLALEQSVLNIPAAGTGTIVFGAGVTSTSMYFGGLAGSTNFALQRGGNPASLTLTGSAANAIFTGALVGGTTLTKAGGGIQTLSGANTYAGNTTILEGGLSLDYNANANGGNPIIPSTSALTMGGTTGFIKNTLSQSNPILQVQGPSTGPVTQTFNGLTLNAGTSLISARGLNGNTATLALGAITHNAGSSVAFSNLNDGVAGSQGIITTSSTANATTGLLGGWAVVNATPANSAGQQLPTAYATISGGTVVPYTSYTGAQTFTDNATVGASFTGGANQNFKFVLTNGTATSEYSVPNGVTTDLNTLLLDASSSGRLKLDIGVSAGTPTSTAILRFGVDGGVFMAAASNTRTNLGFGASNPGFITAGGPTDNTPGTLTFQLNNRLDVFGSIIDNGTGAVTVIYNVYNTSQTPTINTPSNYSGGTYVNSGRIQMKTNAGFGIGPVTIGPAGQVFFSDSESYSNNFFISGNAGNLGSNFDTPSALRMGTSDTISGNITLLADSTIVGAGNNNNLTGQISGNYNLQFNQNVNGAGSGNITLSNPNNNWSGDTSLRGGSLVLTVAGALPAGTNLSIYNAGVVTANALPVGKALSVGTLDFFGTLGKLDLNNNDLIVHSGTLANVTSLVQVGFNNGGWNGAGGIVSTTAASNTRFLTALGTLSNNDGSGHVLYGSGGPLGTTFGGATPTLGDILVKYTYYGDADLSGTVNGADYQQIDQGFGLHLTGWQNGDFNYDGVVNGSDFALIDNTVNQIAATGASPLALFASPASLIASPAAISAVPEPATLGVLGIGALGLLGRRRRR